VYIRLSDYFTNPKTFQNVKTQINASLQLRDTGGNDYFDFGGRAKIPTDPGLGTGSETDSNTGIRQDEARKRLISLKLLSKIIIRNEILLQNARENRATSYL